MSGFHSLASNSVEMTKLTEGCTVRPKNRRTSLQSFVGQQDVFCVKRMRLSRPHRRGVLRVLRRGTLRHFASRDTFSREYSRYANRSR